MHSYLTCYVYLLYYHYSDSVIVRIGMKSIRIEPQESKDIPQNGAQMSVEERLKIIANLIVDRILEQQHSEGVTHRL